MVDMELWVNDPTPVLTGGRGLLVLCTGSALAGTLCVCISGSLDSGSCEMVFFHQGEVANFRGSAETKPVL